MITQSKRSLHLRAATPLEGFAADLSGELLLPGHPEYNDARKIWNGMFDRYPAMIVRCGDATDVSRALRFARGQGLQVAVRGGGHNSAGYAMVDGGLVLAGMVVHPIERTEELLRFYRAYAHAAPDELTAYASIVGRPNGTPMAAIAVCYDGPIAEGERLLAPLRAFGTPLADMIRPMSYLEVVHMLDAGSPDGRKYYDRANSLAELNDEVIATIADYAATRTSPFSQILIQHIHGAAARIDPAATAAHALRGEQFLLGIVAAWEDDDAETHQSWVRAFWSETRQFARAGTYINFLSEDEGGRVQSSYGPNYERLVAIKAKYDPANVFRLNQNIKPAS